MALSYRTLKVVLFLIASNAHFLRFGDTFANEGMLALLRETNIPMFAQVWRFRARWNDF